MPCHISCHIIRSDPIIHHIILIYVQGIANCKIFYLLHIKNVAYCEEGSCKKLRVIRAEYVLAMFDYVSGDHEIKICPSSMSQLSFNFKLLISVVGCPGQYMYARTYFEFLRKTYFPIFHDFSVFVNFRFQRPLLPQIAFQFFQTSPEFSSQRSLQKLCLGFFEIFSFRFFRIFSRKFHVRHCNIQGSHYGTVIISKMSHRSQSGTD